METHFDALFPEKSRQFSRQILEEQPEVIQRGCKGSSQRRLSTVHPVPEGGEKVTLGQHSFQPIPK